MGALQFRTHAGQAYAECHPPDCGSIVIRTDCLRTGLRDDFDRCNDPKSTFLGIAILVVAALSRLARLGPYR